MKRAQKLGAKVITFDADSGVEAAVLRQSGHQRFDRPLRRRLVKAMGEQGQGRDRLRPADGGEPERLDRGVQGRDEEAGYQDIEIVDAVYGHDNEQKAFDLTVALTTKYPDLAGIYAPTCPGLPAVARALELVNKGQGEIKLSGICVPSITAKYMLDGTIEGFYLWDPIKLGYVTYYAAKLFSEGKIKGKAGDSFTIAEGNKWPGTYKIDDNGEIITGEPLQFTEENYKEYDLLAFRPASEGRRVASAPPTSRAPRMARASGGRDPRMRAASA